MLAQKATVATLALGLAAGCAARDANRGLSFIGDSHRTFWPPPPATTTWISDAGADTTLGEAARRVAHTLDEAGQPAARWYPIGIGYAHGFAVTTRVERIDADARPAAARWDALYPEAASLQFLAAGALPEVSEPGRYRATLIAFTDLPPPGSHAAPRWNEGTWMDGPDAVDRRIPPNKRAGSGYRVYAYVYEYAAAPGETVAAELEVAAMPDQEVKRAGLEGLDAIVR